MATALDAQTTALITSMNSVASALKNLVTQTGATAAAVAANGAAIVKQNAEADDFQKQLIKNRKMSVDQQKLAEQAFALKKKELDLAFKLKAARDEENKLMLLANASEKQKNDQRLIANDLEKQHAVAQIATTKAAADVEHSFTFMAKSAIATNAALAWFGATLATQGKQLIAQYKGSGGAFEGASGKMGVFGALIDQQNEGWKRGLSGVDFQKFSMQMRQTVNAMGGTAEAFKTIDPAIDKFRMMTGDSTEAMKMAVEATKYFSNSGVKPTANNLEDYRQSLVQLTRQTGMQGEAAQAYFNDIASDADSIAILRNARKGERESILANQRAMVLNAQATGMNAEQAKEATKMLQSMVAAKPLDRLKEAAKVRALGGALGIEGADKAAAGITAGKNATPQQQADMQKFFTAATNKVDQSASQGLGTEIFTQQLVDKLDLDKYLGKSSPFSTTLGDSLKPMAGTLEKYVDVATTQAGANANTAALRIDQAALLASGNFWGGSILAGITTIATIMLSGKMFDKVGGVLGKVLGTGAKAEGAAGGALGAGADLGVGAAKGAGAEAAALSTAAKTAGLLAKSAKILGPVASVGAGAYEGYNEYKTTGKAGSAIGTGVGTAAGGIGGGWAGAAGGAAAGALIGSFVPVIGTAIGAAAGGIIGAMGGGWAGGELGGALGKKIGSLADKAATPTSSTPDSPAANVANAPIATTPVKAVSNDPQQRAADASDAIQTATETTATAIAQQVKQAGASNELLKLIADLTARSVALAEKQLIASTLTDTEKGDSKNRANLRKDNKFGSQYNYV